MNPTNLKRSIVLNGHKTSVSLGREFWEALRQIATSQNTKLTRLLEQIDQGRDGGNLSSAIRVFLFKRTQIAGAQVRPREEELKDRTSRPRSRPISGSSVDNAPHR
jgi:predicted DNA-binding ribbon-helix-helix protein